MGGYGCVRYATTHAGEFGVIAPIIGLLDFPREGLPEGQSYRVPVERFGRDSLRWPDFNPLLEAKRLKGSSVLLITAEDAFDRTMNENFHARLNELQIEHDWRVLAGGHQFEVVRNALPLVIQHAEQAFQAKADDRELSLQSSPVEALVTARHLPATGLTPLDWGIIGCYGLGMLGVGWYYSRHSDSAEEYFLGNRRMNPFLVGVSLFVTLLSTISYLSMPGEVVGKGPAYLARVLAYPLAYLAVGFILLPIYMRQRVTSAYELLEARLGLSVRLLGGILFVVSRLVWMSLLVYLSAKATTVMLGVDETWIPTIVLFTGAVTVMYTSMGGVRAVVITDLFQTVLLFGGALLVLAVVTFRTGGLQWFPTTWQSHWDSQPLFSVDPATRVSVVGTVVSTFLFLVTTSGGDQTSVQRFMSTKDARSARRAMAVQMSVATTVSLTLGLVGLALLGYYQTFVSQLPPELSLKANADDLFPYFITYQLPPGVSGLVVAAMFAAAMSSLDSGVNSITAVVMSDFLDRFGFRPRSEKSHLRTAQFLALSIGVLVVLGSSLMGQVPGNITAVTSKTANLLTPTIFCLFFFALFVPFATTTGVWVGAIAGTAAAILSGFSGPIFGVSPRTGSDPVSFQWISLISLVVNLGVGGLVSLATAGRRLNNQREV